MNKYTEIMRDWNYGGSSTLYTGAWFLFHRLYVINKKKQAVREFGEMEA